jgi:diguanylate cyclase (GGDEF)-like protein
MPRKTAPKARNDLHARLAARAKELEEENRRLRAGLAFLEGNQGGLETLSERILRISEITQELNTLDLERIGAVAVSRIPTLVRAASCSLYLYDYGENALQLLAASQKRTLSEQVSLKHPKQTVMAHAFQSRQTVLVRSFGDHEKETGVRLERPFASKYATETCISMPLMTANFLVGILNVADREGAPFDPATDLAPLEQVARVLSMAVRNCRLFKEVQSQAHTDALTKLGNFRAFQESLRAETHRAERYGRPLGLVMLDIDEFKQLNDAFGHQAGDLALSELGHIIRGAIRREDLAARYGGDEIAILLPETKPRGCLMVVQRLLAAVRAHAFTFEGRRLPISISIGVAAHRPPMTPPELVGKADEALYRAKQSGRNRFEFADGNPEA